MTEPSDISMETNDVLRHELALFKDAHRELNERIQEMIDTGATDQLTIQRMKKEKLLLKDKITNISNRLTPDIIA